MHADDKPARPVDVAGGNRRNVPAGRFETYYTEQTARIRMQSGVCTSHQARPTASAAVQRRMDGLQGEPSFRELGEEWLGAQTHLRPRTHDLYRTALQRHLGPCIGEMGIAEIDEDVIAALIAQLQVQGLSGWSVRGILVPLGGVLSYAVRRRLIPDNPLRRLERRERPQVIRREMRILHPGEIDALLRAAPTAYRPLLSTAVFTGLRQSELLGLRWADCDLEGGVLHVRRQLDRSGAYSQPKTAKALRDVVLMPSLAAVLREHRLASRHSDATDPVFATATGRPMYYRNVTRRGLSAAITKAGLLRGGEPRLRFHDLRHTYASLLIAQGARELRLLRGAGPAISLSFSRDGRSLAVVGRNRHVQVWDLVSGRAQPVRARKVTAAAFSPDGRRLVTGGKDNLARIWDLRTGTLVGSPLAGHTKPLTSAAYSPNGRYVVTTSFDHDARVWDARTGRPVWTLRGHFAVISNATFSSDSRWVLTAGPGSAGVWDMTTGRPLSFLNGRDRLLTSAAFSPRGWRIVTGGYRGLVKTYDCRLCGNIDDLIAIAQQRLANLRH